MNLNENTLIVSGQRVLNAEARAIENLANCVSCDFARACEAILACQGRIIVTGMGKSGHIGRKIAATLASTGTPAFFMHPGEASHGDLGMVTAQDNVIAISHSGEADELKFILPLIKRLGSVLIAVTGNLNSSMAAMADIHLHINVTDEACPLGLAPTSSTTATLAMGDALAVAVLEARGFTREDFARSHPAGKLGKQLLIRVEDVMHKGEAIPIVTDNTTLKDSLVEMTHKCLGMTMVVATTPNRPVLGIFTDGDLRRALEQNADVINTPIHSLMTTTFKTIKQETLAIEALHLMQTYKINALPVVNQNGDLVGALNMHDLLRTGVF